MFRLLLLITCLLSISSLDLRACTGTVSGSDTVCTGQTSSYDISFQGSGGTAPYTFSYTIDGGGIQTVTSDMSGFASVPFHPTISGTINYQLVEVADSGGCDTIGDFGTAIVLVVVQPQAWVTGDTSVVQGSPSVPVVFHASGTAFPYTFHYTINNGPVQTVTTAPNSTTATIYIPATTPGTIVITLTSTSCIFPCLCELITSTSTVIVTPASNPCSPGPNGTISGPFLMCLTEGLGTITLQGSGGSGGYTFHCVMNGSPVTLNTTGTNAAYTFNPPYSGVFNFTLTAVTSNGCTTAVNSTISINVISLPFVNSNYSVCAGSTVSIVSGSPIGLVFNSSDPAVATVSSTGIVMGMSAGIAVVTVSSGFCSVSTQITVSQPSATISLAGSATVCLGSFINPYIMFTGSGGSPSYTFTYNVNGGPNQLVSSGGSDVASIIPSNSSAGVYTYNLISVSSAAGCSRAVSGSVTVTVLPAPIISGYTTICAGSTGMVTANSPPWMLSSSPWSSDNPSVATISSSGLVTGVSAGMTTIRYTDINGCQTLANEFVNPQPIATISGTASVCAGGPSTVLTFTGNGALAPYTFHYKINGGPTINLTSNAAGVATVSVPSTIAGAFVYSLVSVNSFNGCSNAAPVSFTVTVNPLPVISGNVPVCSGNPLQLTASMGGNSNPWTSSDPSVATIDNSGLTSTLTGGTSTVTFTSVSGCSVNVSLIVNSSPSASISSDATACENSPAVPITFTGSNGSGSQYTFSYSVDGGTVQTISSNSGTSATLTVGTVSSSSYELLSVLDVNGCSSAVNQTSNVTVNPLPVISGNVPVCSGNPLQLTASMGGNSNPWTSSDPSVATIDNSGLTSTLTGGTSTVTFTSVSGCSVNVSLIVNSSPSASISSDATACENSPAVPITFTGSNGSGSQYTFSYSVDGGTVQTISSNSGTSATLTVGTVSSSSCELLSVLDVNGCSSAVNQFSTITINPTPVINQPMPDFFSCDSAAMPVIDFTTAFLPASVNWSIVQNPNSAEEGNIPAAYFAPGTWEIVYYPATTFGCAGTVDTFEVKISQPPIVTAGNDFSICEGSGDQLVLDGLVQNAVSYSWSSDLCQVTDVNDLHSAVTAPQSGVAWVWLTAENSDGCTASDSLVISILPSPNVGAITTSPEGCAPFSAYLSSYWQENGYQYEWYINSQPVSSQAEFNTILSDSGHYDVSLVITDANGCSDSVSNSSMIVVFPDPVAAFTLGGDEFATNELVQAHNQSSNATAYSWYIDNGLVSNDANPVLIMPDEAGMHTVELVASTSHGCTSTVWINFRTTSDLIFYVPNAFTPNADQNNAVFLPVFTEGFDEKTYQLYIFDRWGEVIFSTQDILQGWDGSYLGLPSQDGVYTWKIHIGEKASAEMHDYTGHVTLLR